MKTNLKLTAALLCAGILAVGTARTAEAVGTQAGTDITNTASISYKVGGVDQTAKPSNTVTFKVDRKVNLTVTRQDAALVEVSPGQLAAVLTFSVTNLCNDATNNFSLEAIAEANGTADPFGGSGTDSFDATNVKIFVDGVQATTIAGLSSTSGSNSKTVTIVVDIPIDRVDTNMAVYAMKATVTGVTETSGADTPGTVDTVFADAAGSDDAARDAAHSARSAFLVKAPVLTVAKTATILSDPTNGTTNPKAIPGAIIEYAVTVTNAGTAKGTATNVTLTDNLNAAITAGVAFNANAYAAGKGIRLIKGASTTDLTNTNADADGGDFTGTTVTVSGVTLAPGESASVKYQVTIN